MTDAPFALVKTSPRFEKAWNGLQTGIEILVSVIVVAALLGLCGTGPLSSATQEIPGGAISIAYDRILRRTTQTELAIHLAQPRAEAQFAIELPTSFLRGMDVVATSPRSSAMRTEADGITYVFDLGASRTGTIAFTLKAKGFGPFTSRFVAAGTPIEARQFILP